MDIADWLRSLSLEQYVKAFSDNDIDAEVLSDLTGDDLEKMGIASIGHRRKLLKAISGLNAQPTSDVTRKAATPSTLDSSHRIEAPLGQAERRQVTVLFCDLVGSTELAARLDPEDMSELLRTYRNCCAETIARWDGHIAQYLGDGVLAYFGWPRAHEGDAERAVRAGLDLVAAVIRLNTREGKPLTARVGIATGQVVAGDLTIEDGAQERNVVGDTPNLAARLHGLAEPGQVVLSEATRRLVGDTFEIVSLGLQSLKGFPGLVSVSAVSGVRATESRFAARVSGSLSPMVGRDHELGLIVERWKQAKAGEGQFVLTIGEAGIGKSRLTRGMIDVASTESHIRVSYQCSPYHADSPLYPAVQQLTFAAGFTKDDTNDDMLDRLEATLGGAETDRPLIAALLGLEFEERYGKLDLTPRQQRTRTLQALVRQLLALASSKPVHFVVEDMHWIDATTLELIDLYLDPVSASRVMILATARPTFQHGFGGHPIVTKLTLNRLGREQATVIVSRLAGGKTVPGAVIDIIAAKTDGVPLFIEEFTKTILESGELLDTGDAYELTGPLNNLRIPSSLYDSLMSRLDRLQSVKEVAQVAACIGRSFDYSLLQTAAPVEEKALRDALAHLVEAELIFQRGEPPDATYIFKHALMRDAAYDTLLKTRRQSIHMKLLEVLEQRDSAPEVLAHNALAAGQIHSAVRYLLKAGQQAAARSANKEAINHLKAGITLLDEILEGPDRQRLDLGLHSTLASVLMVTLGYASDDVGRVATHAMELSRHFEGDVAEIAATVWQAWLFNYTRANHKTAAAIAQDLLNRTKNSDNPAARVIANLPIGLSLFALGKPFDARSHLEQGIETSRQSGDGIVYAGYGMEIGAVCVAYASWIQGAIGFADQSRRGQSALESRLEDVGHPYTTSRGLYWCAAISATLKDWAQTLAFEQRSTKVSIQYEFQMTLSISQVLRGVASSYIIPESSWMTECRNGLNAYRRTGAQVQVPFLFALVAEALLNVGKIDEGLAIIAEAITLIIATGEEHVAAEIYRLKGDLLWRSGDRDVEPLYRKALVLSHDQGSRLFELRAAVSLARLWLDQGRRDDATSLLVPIYNWFTEGFDTSDLKAARVLLDNLRRD